jgi:sulfopyruvate decarboxylase subunit alpha
MTAQPDSTVQQTPPPRRAPFIHDMNVVRGIHGALRDAGVGFAAYLPETILYPVMHEVEQDTNILSVCVAREDEGVAMAAGAFLGGRWPVLLTEASGLGLSSLILARAMVMRTPLLMLVGHNETLGERHDYISATRRVAEPLLRGLGIPHVVCRSGAEAPMLVREAQLTVQGDKRPVAVLFPRHTLHVETELS